MEILSLKNLERMEKAMIILLVFLFGFLASLHVNNPDTNFEFPLQSLLVKNSSQTSPADYITEDNIFVYPDRVVIMVDSASISRYEATGSMRPVLDAGTNGIRVKPSTEEDINIGDIVSFREKDYLVAHRVIEKGTDELGIYFITKGDNNNFSDSKIRFEDIEYVTVGLIY